MLNHSFYLLFVALFAIACGGSDAPAAETGDAISATGAQASQGVTYMVDPAASQVTWVGSKPTGTHTGTFDVSAGKMMVNGDNITGGEFTIDIASLTVTDLDEENGKGKLEGHLTSADFFETEKYPDAKFEIASITPISDMEGATHKMVGNLSMHGESKSVSIPVNVSMSGDKLMATTPAFTINRTDWNIKYGSGLIGTAQDKLINDDVELTIKLEAKKA